MIEKYKTIQRYPIQNVRISKVSLSKTIEEIEKTILLNVYGYICVSNSRTVYFANNNSYYCEIQNKSLLTVPDGIPLVWIAHNLGFRDVGRVAGPDLMAALFKKSVEKKYSHYFFGSTQQTIDQMKINLEKKYPGLVIKGAVSPPFQPLDKFDIEGLAKEINSLKPTFFWCGLGAPKQELLNSLLQPKLESTICVGVGLAFEYIAGNVKRAPNWMQTVGLEWIYRLTQQPQNIKRAIVPLSWIFQTIIVTYIKNFRWHNRLRTVFF
jgi:N-acetylglucosaminyldiphosphoundecaprenol N-acetyl-beta-D-mannosaminyltransferase